MKTQLQNELEGKFIEILNNYRDSFDKEHLEEADIVNGMRRFIPHLDEVIIEAKNSALYYYMEKVDIQDVTEWKPTEFAKKSD